MARARTVTHCLYIRLHILHSFLANLSKTERFLFSYLSSFRVVRLARVSVCLFVLYCYFGNGWFSSSTRRARSVDIFIFCLGIAPVTDSVREQIGNSWNWICVVSNRLFVYWFHGAGSLDSFFSLLFVFLVFPSTCFICHRFIYFLDVDICTHACVRLVSWAKREKEGNSFVARTRLMCLYGILWWMIREKVLTVVANVETTVEGSK